ncbi:hypothetical protein ACFQE1_14900, partial [Halobium palmae]
MKTPHERETADGDEGDVRVRELEHDDGTRLVADVGGAVGVDASLDVVEGTAIIVDGGGSQVEIDLPDGAVADDVVLNNGVLTVE